jgi:phage shock protein A
MWQRLTNLIRGFFGLFISGLERQNPEALLEVETENLRKQIAQYNQGLASHAGLCERLMSQIKKLEAEERDLRAKATANLRAGNRDAAGQYALRLQTVQRELEENRKQMEQAETTYKDLLKARDIAVSSARAKIEALKSSLSDLKMKRAMAELTEMASGMISSIGGSGDTLDRLQTMVEDERTKAAGRVSPAIPWTCPACKSRKPNNMHWPTRHSRTLRRRKGSRWSPPPPRPAPRNPRRKAR